MSPLNLVRRARRSLRSSYGRRLRCPRRASRAQASVTTDSYPRRLAPSHRVRGRIDGGRAATRLTRLLTGPGSSATALRMLRGIPADGADPEGDRVGDFALRCRHRYATVINLLRHRVLLQ